MSDIGEELRATLEARREVGTELEPELVERFVDRLEQEMDRRIDERLAQRSRQRAPAAPSSTGMALGSLALAIPLLGVAGGTAGLGGVIIVCLAIVLVNAMWASRR